MTFKFVRLFILSAGMLLLMTSMAKLISASSHAHILQFPDPIFQIPFRYVFWVAGIIELLIVFICVSQKKPWLQSALIAWLATTFLFYRIGLWWFGWQRPCPCLGNFTDALHISPQTADTFMKFILAYLLIGSYATLFWLWRQRKRAISASLPAQ